MFLGRFRRGLLSVSLSGMQKLAYLYNSQLLDPLQVVVLHHDDVCTSMISSLGIETFPIWV